MKTLVRAAAMLLLMTSLSSCSTYVIPTDRFQQQLAAGKAAGLKEVTVKGPTGFTTKYNTYPIDSIQCIDKRGNAVQLKNSPAIEVRITDRQRKKTIFYFDRIQLHDTTITGTTSRIAGFTKTIALNNIVKIEVQNGKKAYRYVQ